MTKYSLTIGWLYPELMSTYGDRGNITVLQKRCEWRGIEVNVVHIDQTTSDQRLKTIDLLFGGGAQDREQGIVMKDLYKKRTVIKNLIEQDVPALFVCGAPQLMGKYYEPSVGKRIKGLGIFDMISKHPGVDKPRLIGNMVAQCHLSTAPRNDKLLIVGFENHGGRTYLGKNAKPFAQVIKGFGNNGEDGTEGVVYKNAIGCYLHGPLLPKNPAIADYLIKKALEVKYKKEIELQPLDDNLEQKANEAILKKLEVNF
ncbi:MAG TPA: type 1 glutamine amidotransferase [Methylomirabilota bacterium]|nr:type 1 glutamine amidotransferase [Methylomirabilota bacterium]